MKNQDKNATLWMFDPDSHLLSMAKNENQRKAIQTAIKLADMIIFHKKVRENIDLKRENEILKRKVAELQSHLNCL